MNILRKILFPVAILYWLVTFIRNWLYDVHFFKSFEFDANLPIIAIGNLSVGGTGKTPHTEFLIRMLQKKYKIAVLSRGYKRSTKGFVLANEQVSAEELGDESFQMYNKFPNVTVAVCEDRKIGIENLIATKKTELILLDDAFQHRKVKASFYILLTTYNDLFSDDYILPFGNLRESAFEKKRANAIIVTKCPNTLSETEQQQIKQKLNVNVPVFFTTIQYDSEIFSAENSKKVENILATEKVIIAGIAKPKYFINYLNSGKDKVLIYADHHNFSQQEISELNALAKYKMIVTTEKDYVRLNGKINAEKLYYLPIKINFLQAENKFEKLIFDAVKFVNTN